MKTYTVVFKDGTITEFEAVAQFDYTQEEPSNATELRIALPLNIVGPIRTGSIYDKEGSD